MYADHPGNRHGLHIALILPPTTPEQFFIFFMKMTKSFVPNSTGFQGLSRVLPRRRKSARYGLAPLEMILVLPVVVFLLVMIYYVAASGMQKHDLVSACRNDAWDGRYQSNARYRPQNLKPFVPAFPNGNISASVDNKPVKTGFYFDLWKQTANTKHLVLAKTWDHENEKLNRHPVFLNTDFISSFLKGFGMDIALEAGKNWLQDQLDDMIDEIVLENIKDVIPTLEDVEWLEQTANEILDDLLGVIDGEDSLYEDAIDELDIDTNQMSKGANALAEETDQEIENIQNRIKELETLKQSLISVDYRFNDLLLSEHGRGGVVRFVALNTQESDPELDEEIRKIDEKIYQLQLILDALKKIKQSADNIQQKVASIIKRVTDLGNIEETIKRMVNDAKAAVSRARNQIKTIIADLRKNPLDLFKHQSNIDKFISDAQNSVRKMTNDIEALLKKVKKIKDDVEGILQEINNIRTEFNKIKQQIREL